MKILILTTYYPPDTAIAAVRPYMFAKYLTKLGHSVTVLRSGEINNYCGDFFETLPNVRVVSYLGEDSPAEAYQRGEWIDSKCKGKSRIAFLPEQIRMPIAKLYHRLIRQKESDCWIEKRMAYLEKQKAALNAMKDEAFDIIFSTVGELENIFAGQYAKKLFSCPLIQDFRDQMATRDLQTKKEYANLKKIQDEAVQKADACTAVSEGVLQNICCSATGKMMVLYNGYEAIAAEKDIAETAADQLSFCYTGQLYGGMRDFSPMLKALRKLADAGKVSLDKVRIHYAGKDFDYLLQQARKHNVTEILVDHGYVGRKEAAKMQAESDMFVVLSWNTATAKGVLTGKFYEGIRAGKPILSIVAGNVPHSELDLINQKYRYGFCYESCREKEQFGQLCDYLENAYQEKMQSGTVTCASEPALETDFRYDTLAKQLETLCFDLIQHKK